jgi:hypothetical protein
MINFVLDNWAEIIAAIVALDVLAGKIVKATGSKRGAAILAVVDKFVGFIRR